MASINSLNTLGPPPKITSGSLSSLNTTSANVTIPRVARKSQTSIASLSISPDYDITQSNHTGPKPSAANDSSDLLIPQYRSSSPSIPSLILPLNDLPMVGFGSGDFLQRSRRPSTESLLRTSRVPIPVPVPSPVQNRPSTIAESPPPLPQPSPVIPAVQPPSPSPQQQQIPPVIPVVTNIIPESVSINMRQYEDTIAELQARSKMMENESKSLREKNEALIKDAVMRSAETTGLLKERESESDRLMRENAVLLEKLDVEQRNAVKNSHWAHVTPDEWTEMNQRIQILIRENDLLVENMRAAQKETEKERRTIDRQAEELEHLHQELSTSQSTIYQLQQHLSESQSRQQSSDREIKRLVDELRESNQSIERLESESKTHINEIKNGHRRVMELRKSLDEVTSRYHENVEEATGIAKREKQLIEALRGLEDEIDGYKNEVSSLDNRNKKLQDENEEVLRLSKGLEKRIADLEAREVEAINKVHHAIEKERECLLERDKALLKAKQFEEEVAKLNGQYSDVCQKYRLKAETDISVMRAQFATERRKYQEEISKLETSLAQAQAFSERAIREKRAIENELEKTTLHIPEETERMNAIVEEMALKMRVSERERVEAMEMVGVLQQKLHREQNRVEKEKEELAFRLEESHRRLRRAEKDLEDAKENGVKWMSQITQLEQDNAKLMDIKEKNASKFEADLRNQALKHEQQASTGFISELTSKLEATTESHSRTCRELQTLLTNQHDLSHRWKIESKSISNQYQSQITDLNNQLSKSQERIHELEAIVKDCVNGRREAVGDLEEERRVVERLRGEVRNLEGKCESLGRKVEGFLKREMELQMERKGLQRELDRVKLEKERIERERQGRVQPPPSQYYLPSKRFTKPRSAKNTGDASESDNDVKALKAEINRVKNRSRMLNPPAT
ncbi:hypothetical protein HDU76_013105 [Blyttiomyces sp. JEL0837]|nr:hypothetical protein HDU76_013105 [Blyttiomyces sp. JEL0837]